VSDTTAVPLAYLATANYDRVPPEGQGGRPLCPACVGGRLHPYMVEIGLTQATGWHGVDYLVGWVAVCVGAKAADGVMAVDVEPCGFSLPMTPRTYAGDRAERERGA